MKVSVLSTPIFKLPCVGYSGLEHLAWQIAHGLAKKGHDVSLVAPDGSECPGVTVIPVGVERTINEKMAYDKYWQHLPSFDVIIDHTWSKHSYCLKAEGRLPAPILGVCHAPVNTMYGSPPPVDKPCIVCISDDQKNHWEALHGKPAKRVYNGIDLDFYKPLDVKRSNRFLFLARFSTIKSPDLCQDVCIANNVGLDLVGDTTITGEPEYLEKCKSKADGKLIRMVGGVNRGESVWWMSQCFGFLHLNKLFREPFGLAPVEAQLCGAGVLCWDYGAMRETVKHGETGFLVRSVEEVSSVVKSGMIGSLNRERCREWASQYSLNRMISGYEELAREAVETGGW